MIFEDGTFGRKAVLRSEWNDSFLPKLKREQVVELELNHARGWQGEDVAFLQNLPELRALEIIDFRIKDISAVHCLHRLRRLGILTYCKTALRFSDFPKLESCSLEWRPKATSLFDHRALKDLFVNSYKAQDLRALARIVTLQSLMLLNCSARELSGLGPLKSLHSLRLGRFIQLRSLEGISELKNLETLSIRACRRFTSIDEIGSLTRLTTLAFGECGKIDSLRCLDNLSHLTSITFDGSTNIVDGDLSPLLRQKYLTNVAFANRRHYSHRNEQIKEILRMKHGNV
jgi:Leucine-rich repeat (LRR) protein